MIYVASKASVEKYPKRWRQLRAQGWPINSTWIDEAGEGQTADWGELWVRIVREITEAKGVVLWCDADGLKLKGALVEVGIALGQGKPVAIVSSEQLNGLSGYHPIGTWLHHPLVLQFYSMENGLKYVLNFPQEKS